MEREFFSTRPPLACRAWPKGRKTTRFFFSLRTFRTPTDVAAAQFSLPTSPPWQRCAIRRADVSISALLASWDQPLVRDCELAGRLCVPFPRLPPAIAWGRERERPTPLFFSSPSLISPRSRSYISIHYYSPGAALAAQARAAIMATKRRDRAIF